jgi:hypothetical protein
MQAKVYYWKDSRYLRDIEFAQDSDTSAAFPDRQQFEADYCLVATFDVICDEAIRQGGLKMALQIAADTAWRVMNLDPSHHFRTEAYAEGVHHTSMSVGDIVIMGELALIAMPFGWERITFAERGEHVEIESKEQG